MQIIIDTDGMGNDHSLVKRPWSEVSSIDDGKPVGDVWIDDRAMHYDNNWDEITEKLLEK